MYSFRSIILLIFTLFAVTAGVIFIAPPSPKEFARVSIHGAPIVAEVAKEPETRARGLSGRRNLPLQNGMLFIFPQADFYTIWMKDMKIPLDILWINKGRVVDVEEKIHFPISGARDSDLVLYRPDVPAEFVLEVNSGFVEDHSIKIGDDVSISFRGELLGNSPEDVTDFPTGYAYYIDTLRRRGPDGKDFRVGQLLSDNKSYRKYSIFYDSGDLRISGIMNVPAYPPPASGFPVLILNHGLIPEEIYFSGRGSRREQDFFTRHGYVTIHPDYRGLGSSTPVSSTEHDFYVEYSEDVMNLLDALKSSGLSFIDPNRIGMWGHSMGGGIAARIMVLRPEVKAYVLFAPISADVKDNFFELSEEELALLGEKYGEGEEADKTYEKISPLAYFSEVKAPVQIHHGTADAAVPISFSEKMYTALSNFGKKAEFFVYPGQKHEFIEDWPLAAERSLQFFDKYVGDAR